MSQTRTSTESPAGGWGARYSSGPSRWFEWRYAAAGLGWGALVGAVTGVVLALVMVLGGMGEGVGLSDGVTVLLIAVVVGAFWGATLGGLIGALSGLLTALLLPHLPSERLRWWTAFLVPSVVALVLVAGVMGLDAVRGVTYEGSRVEPGVLVNLLPALALGLLMARTSRSVQAERDRLSHLTTTTP